MVRWGEVLQNGGKLKRLFRRSARSSWSRIRGRRLRALPVAAPPPEAGDRERNAWVLEMAKRGRRLVVCGRTERAAAPLTSSWWTGEARSRPGTLATAEVTSRLRLCGVRYRSRMTARTFHSACANARHTARCQPCVFGGGASSGARSRRSRPIGSLFCGMSNLHEASQKEPLSLPRHRIRAPELGKWLSSGKG